MQNKMVRFILNLHNRAHIGCKELDKVNMLSVHDRIKQNKLNHVFKIWNGSGPEYMKEHFHKISDTELRGCTRASKNYFFLPRVKGQSTNTFYFTGIKNWNSLPATCKDIQNYKTFKEKVKINLSNEAKILKTYPFIFFNKLKYF